ncbi:hypothetical protein ABGB12_17720, partial [Actinocorallia sp. B10E7]
MTQPQLFDTGPLGHRPLVAHGTGPFEARLRLLERIRAPFVLTARAAALLWGLALPRRVPAAVPLELAVPCPASAADPPEPTAPAAVPKPSVSAPAAPKPISPARAPVAVPPGPPVLPRLGRGDPPVLHLLPEDVTTLDGHRLTTAERTAYDCARSLPRYEALALVDQFLAQCVSRPALMARARRATGPGATQSRAVIAMADPAAQSPGESLIRGVLVDTGFPRPTCQLPAPPTPYRLDLGHARYRCAVEYDGEAHHTGPRNRSHDAFRRARLAALGWRILPVTRDFRTRPAPYLDAWLTLLLQSGWSPTPTHLTALTRRIRALHLPLRLLPLRIRPPPPPPPPP